MRLKQEGEGRTQSKPNGFTELKDKNPELGEKPRQPEFAGQMKRSKLHRKSFKDPKTIRLPSRF